MLAKPATRDRRRLAGAIGRRGSARRTDIDDHAETHRPKRALERIGHDVGQPLGASTVCCLMLDDTDELRQARDSIARLVTHRCKTPVHQPVTIAACGNAMSRTITSSSYPASFSNVVTG
jgi:hypothetical protein